VEVQQTIPTRPVASLHTAPAVAQKKSMKIFMPAGVLVTLLYCGLALSLPILYFYSDSIPLENNVVTEPTDETKVVVIGLSAVVGLFLLISVEVKMLFNMILFFHVGLEAYVLDKLMSFADEDTTSDEDMAIAYVTFGVIIVHLIPFFVVNKTSFLSILAFVGVVVNSTTTILVDTLVPHTLLVGLSSSALLLSTRDVSFSGESPSLLSQLITAVTSKSCVQCRSLV
jgi:hypothetical protein